MGALCWLWGEAWGRGRDGHGDGSCARGYTPSAGWGTPRNFTAVNEEEKNNWVQQLFSCWLSYPQPLALVFHALVFYLPPVVSVPDLGGEGGGLFAEAGDMQHCLGVGAVTASCLPGFLCWLEVGSYQRGIVV